MTEHGMKEQEKTKIDVEKLVGKSSVKLNEELINDSMKRTWDKIAQGMEAPQRKGKRLGAAQRIAMWSAVAASVAIAAVLSINLFVSVNQAPQITAMNDKPENMHIVLPDGSNVWLFTGASISYPETFNSKKREVTINGEAFFDVRKDKKSKFLVHTGLIDIAVLGTRFNVNTYQESQKVDVVLESGLVALSKSSNETVYLRPGKMASIDKLSNISIQDVDVSLYTSWKDEFINLQSQTLKDVAMMLSKRYRVKIEISNECLNEEKFSGRFDQTQSLEKILSIINYSTPINYTMRNGVWYISPR